MVVPEVPGQPSRKPLVQGFGCRLHLGSGTLSCEALFVAESVPTQLLAAELRERHKPPRGITLDWSETPPGLYQNATIDLKEQYADQAEEPR